MKMDFKVWGLLLVGFIVVAYIGMGYNPAPAAINTGTDVETEITGVGPGSSGLGGGGGGGGGGGCILTSPLCFQENANSSDAYDSCPAVIYKQTGNYSWTSNWDDVADAIDRLIITYAATADTDSTPANLTINYTKPTGTTSASTWYLATGNESSPPWHTNVTIPAACWNGWTDTLSFFVESINDSSTSQLWTYCHNGTDWVLLTNYSSISSSGEIMDEGMWWYSDTSYGIC